MSQDDSPFQSENEELLRYAEKLGFDNKESEKSDIVEKLEENQPSKLLYQILSHDETIKKFGEDKPSDDMNMEDFFSPDVMEKMLKAQDMDPVEFFKELKANEGDLVKVQKELMDLREEMLKEYNIKR